jgi:hypothetical protein
MTPIEQLSHRSRRPEDATAEEIAVRAAEHLALEHLQAVDMPFDWS